MTVRCRAEDPSPRRSESLVEQPGGGFDLQGRVAAFAFDEDVVTLLDAEPFLSRTETISVDVVVDRQRVVGVRIEQRRVLSVVAPLEESPSADRLTAGVDATLQRHRQHPRNLTKINVRSANPFPAVEVPLLLSFARTKFEMGPEGFEPPID